MATEWKLTRRLKRQQKPVIRRVGGRWVCFVRIEETDMQAADAALAWCTRMNEHA